MTINSFNNTTQRVIDDLKKEIRRGGKLKIAAASFSIYAYEALKKELEKIDELQFLFTSNVFTKEKIPKEAREFYIPRANRERKLFGDEFEIKLRNELSQKAIAKETAEWIKKKVKFKSNISGKRSDNFLINQNQMKANVYSPFDDFTTAELGEGQGDKLFYNISKYGNENSQKYIEIFDSIWQNPDYAEDVTQTVIDNMTTAYQENAPELIYYIALYNIFSEFLVDLDNDSLPNEKTGFKESKIWSLLYDFQKDAVIGAITKLEKYNGVILADSVGLGKTFSALGVIKYYESRNKNVLVLSPKRLQDNWNTYKNNYKNNPIAEDRLRYDVLFHTDLDRDRGDSNGINLAQINLENYDLVVIDESHNFRNGESTTHRKEDDYENRYQKLLRKIIKSGVKTKVLMLSATPVNNSFSDLKNQLMIASEGESNKMSSQLDTTMSVDEIFAQANKAFKEWSDFAPEFRTTQKLLDLLSFDFFDLLDSVTIARSRKHIETYYKNSDIGKFPTRLAPHNVTPKLTDLPDINYNTIFSYIDQLNLAFYSPLSYVQQSKIEKYVDPSRMNASTWKNREIGRNQLMITNLLKRAESSIYAFRLTSERMLEAINVSLSKIEKFKTIGKDELIDNENFQDEEDDELSVGKDLKINLADMDYVSWQMELLSDQDVLSRMLERLSKVTPERDNKLQTLQQLISKKISNPINPNNKKVIIFTAFADTVDYLYQNLSPVFKGQDIDTAIVSGSRVDTTLNLKSKHFNDILTVFSPRSKNAQSLFGEEHGQIDILFATDVISEGQNLQDADYLINYDIHWNPVRIIQRFGRIDRIGSTNKCIQMVNFWPDITLDDYINLKSRVENKAKLVAMTSTGENTLDNTDPDLEYRKNQLLTLQKEVVDLEEMSSGINIMDLGLNDFHLDLQKLREKYGDYDTKPFGINAVVQATSEYPPGVIFVLKNHNGNINVDRQNRLHPFYLIYISETGEIMSTQFNPKKILDDMRFLTRGKDTPDILLTSKFNTDTKDGRHMVKYSDLLTQAIDSMVLQKNEKDIDSLFTPGPTTALDNSINGLDDFELIDFLVVSHE